MQVKPLNPTQTGDHKVILRLTKLSGYSLVGTVKLKTFIR